MRTLRYWVDFSKRHNSTKRPADSDGYSTGVLLKRGTSIENPTFIIENPTGINPFHINYCHFESHYYFVNDVVVGINDQLELQCTQDVLATYKTSIGNYTAHVVRASSAYDEYVQDSLIVPTTEIRSTGYSVTAIPNLNVTTGCFIVRTVGRRTSSNTGISTYALTREQFRNLMDTAFSDGTYGDILSDATVKTFFNPFQYIVSVMWFPFPVEQVTTAEATNIYLGWWNTNPNNETSDNYKGHLVNTNGYINRITLNIPTKPYGDFRSYDQNFTEWYITIPSAGVVPIPARLVAGGIQAIFSVDWITGEMRTRLTSRTTSSGGTSTAGDGEARCSDIVGQIGVPIQIGQVNPNFLNTASSTLAGVGTMMLGNIVGGMGGISVGVQSALQPMPQGNGTQGSRSALQHFNPNITVSYLARKSRQIPTAVSGRPLYSNVTINTLSGFVQTENSSVPIDGFAGDRELVNSYLNGGFYYE